VLEGVAGSRKSPSRSEQPRSHPEKQSVAVLIQLSPRTYDKPTTHHRTHPGRMLIRAVMEHIEECSSWCYLCSQGVGDQLGAYHWGIGKERVEAAHVKMLHES